MSAPKPGQLWLVRETEGDEFAAFCSVTSRYWIDYEGESWRSGDDATPLRRLIVLDPESADDVERVRQAIGLHHESLIPAKMLRNLAAPPEPEMSEPTALGTVVVDGRGRKWIHADPGIHEPWYLVSGPGGPEMWMPWQRIPRPVRLATDEERGA